MPDPIPVAQPKYGQKNIKDLTDDELWEAIQSVAGMENFRFDKLKDPRINKKNHRLFKIFNTRPATENNTFTQLAIALNDEYLNRLQNRNKQNVENP